MDNISLDDYTVIWPESLINDVLDDNLLDWKAIEEAENDTDEDESNLDTLSTTSNKTLLWQQKTQYWRL